MKLLWAMVLALALGSLLVGGAGLGLPSQDILWQIRVPRTALALLIGGGLAVSGASLQGALRNPLADPGLLGIGGCAALGAVIAYYWGWSASFAPALPVASLLGATVAAAGLLLVAGRGGVLSLILAGVAISSLSAACIALALALAPNPYALAEITFWLLGSIADRSMLHLVLAGPPILIGVAILLTLGRGLDALTLGEDAAASLGRPIGQTLRLAAMGCALAVGGGAAVAGGIGFVGLLVPHLLRPWFGERPSGLLAPSFPAGAALLLAADMLVRGLPLLLPLNGELPVGVVTSMLGAPALVMLARRVAR